MDTINHYSFENHATIYDEEALTVLQLCARLGVKINDLVMGHNKLHELIEALYTSELTKQVAAWLEAHPEVTTTVQDGELTLAKFITGELGFVTPQLFGAKADGLNNDTAAIKKAIACLNKNCQKLYFPAGNYMVDEDIVLPSNVVVYGDGICSNIRRIRNNKTNYHVLLCRGVENVEIRNLRVTGDRSDHDGTTGEWGMAVSIESAKNITISDCKLCDGWGDGVYVGVDSTGAKCENIVIDRSVIDNNRRNGISVISCDGFRLSNSRICNTGGTAPQAGIDFEPNFDTEVIAKCVIDNCVFVNNSRDVMSFAKTGLEITVQNCQLYSSVGVDYQNTTLTDKKGGYFKFVNCALHNSNRCVVLANDTNASPFIMRGCHFYNDNVAFEIGWYGAQIDRPLGGVYLYDCVVEKSTDTNGWFRYMNSTDRPLTNVVLNVHVGEGVTAKRIYTPRSGCEIRGRIESAPATYKASSIDVNKWGFYHRVHANTVDNNITIYVDETAPLNLPVTIRKVSPNNTVTIIADGGTFPLHNANTFTLTKNCAEVTLTRVDAGVWLVKE